MVFSLMKWYADIAPKARGAASVNSMFLGTFAIAIESLTATYSAKQPAFIELMK